MLSHDLQRRRVPGVGRQYSAVDPRGIDGQQRTDALRTLCAPDYGARRRHVPARGEQTP